MVAPTTAMSAKSARQILGQGGADERGQDEPAAGSRRRERRHGSLPLSSSARSMPHSASAAANMAPPPTVASDLPARAETRQ